MALYYRRTWYECAHAWCGNIPINKFSFSLGKEVGWCCVVELAILSVGSLLGCWLIFCTQRYNNYRHWPPVPLSYHMTSCWACTAMTACLSTYMSKSTNSCYCPKVLNLNDNLTMSSMILITANLNPNDIPNCVNLLSFRLRNTCPLILASKHSNIMIIIHAILAIYNTWHYTITCCMCSYI
jgi:hypothetical protein